MEGREGRKREGERGRKGKERDDQTQCPRRISGSKLHTSSAAVEVICGIIPMRFRIWELCNREYVRILPKDEDHELRSLMTLSMRKGIRFCPLEYLKTTERLLHRAIHRDTSISPFKSSYESNFPTQL